MQQQALRRPHRVRRGHAQDQAGLYPARSPSPSTPSCSSSVVVVPLLTSEELPEPTSAVKAFFVEPAAAAAASASASAAGAQGAGPPKAQSEARRSEDAPSSRPPSRSPTRSSPRRASTSAWKAASRAASKAACPAASSAAWWAACPTPRLRPQAVRVGGQIKEPKKLKNVAPVYPDIAKQARVQGVVILECTISPQGKVTDVKVLRGIPLLDAGGHRGGEAVGVHADPAQRRARARHHDRHRELQALLRLELAAPTEILSRRTRRCSLI